jgi:hypothetical protein
VIDITHLPKSMKKRPEIRALALADRVYPGDNPRHFRVAGTSDIYDVHFFQDTYHCGCPAGKRGAPCAHAIAVKNHREKKEH